MEAESRPHNKRISPDKPNEMDVPMKNAEKQKISPTDIWFPKATDSPLKRIDPPTCNANIYQNHGWPNWNARNRPKMTNHDAPAPAHKSHMEKEKQTRPADTSSKE